MCLDHRKQFFGNWKYLNFIMHDFKFRTQILSILKRVWLEAFKLLNQAVLLQDTAAQCLFFKNEWMSEISQK